MREVKSTRQRNQRLKNLHIECKQRIKKYILALLPHQRVQNQRSDPKRKRKRNDFGSSSTVLLDPQTC